MVSGAIEAENRRDIRRADIEWVLESCGLAPAAEPVRREEHLCGHVNGLAVLGAQQGMVLSVDANAVPGSGKIHVTGVVEQERIGAGRGREYVRSGMARDAAEKVGVVLRNMGAMLDRIDVHIDFPGGTPVDGPSAGIAMLTAACSAIWNIPADSETAMTGEISVQGEILPVGGVGKKIDAAERAGLKRVLIPKENWRDVYAQRSIRVIAVSDARQAVSIALGGADGILRQEKGEQGTIAAAAMPEKCGKST